MNESTTGALQARLPYMFPLAGEERCRADILLCGWMPSLVRACEDIDGLPGADKRGFHWTRLREKFGAPSFTYWMEGKGRVAINSHSLTGVRRDKCSPVESQDPVVLVVSERAMQVEVELRSLGIVCGAPSEINNDRGPWASLCLAHRTEDVGPQGHTGPVWAAAELTP